MITIAVSIQKGGVGKTATTISLAASLVTMGSRVLVLDMDPQANTTTGLGIDAYEAHAYDLIIEDVPITNAIYRSKWDGIDVIPTNIDLAAAEVQLVSVMGWSERLWRKLSQLPSDRYDYCIIDTAPSLGFLTRMALAASDYVLIPVDIVDAQAIRGVGHLLEVAASIREHYPGPQVLGIVATRYDRRIRLTDEMMEQAKVHYGSVLMDTVIGIDSQVQYAYSHGTPIPIYNPAARATRDYLKLAKEVVRRVHHQTGR